MGVKTTFKVANFGGKLRVSSATYTFTLGDFKEFILDERTGRIVEVHSKDGLNFDGFCMQVGDKLISPFPFEDRELMRRAFQRDATLFYRQLKANGCIKNDDDCSRTQ